MDDLREMVLDIYKGVVGDKTFGTPGLVDRMEKVEKDVSELKDMDIKEAINEIRTLRQEMNTIKLLRDRILIGSGLITGGLVLLAKIGQWVYDHVITKK